MYFSHFKSITLYNLFSYQGHCTFNFTSPKTDKQNIIVISGRNGRGKTSFLNSIKLLFGGVSETLCRQVARGRKLTEKQYVCGVEEWSGILNRHATQDYCAIEICWQSEFGNVTSKRCWKDIRTGHFKSEIQVSDPLEGELLGAEADEYLQKVLPKEYLSFFFFDAEEIQVLAEANSSQLIEKMEQLLNIRPIENLTKILATVKNKWQKAGMDRTVSADLEKQEDAQKQVSLEVSALEQQEHDLAREIDDLDKESTRLQKKLHLTMGTRRYQNRGEIEERIKNQQKRIAEDTQQLAETLQLDGFLMLLPELVTEAISALKTITEQEQPGQLELLESLKKQLPAIFDSPPHPTPPLNRTQARFYQERLAKQLDVYMTTSQIPVHTLSPDTDTARQTLELLMPYAPQRGSSNQVLRWTQEILKNRHALEDDQEKLQDVDHLLTDEKSQYDALVIEQESVNQLLLDKRDEQRRLQHTINIKTRTGTSYQEKIKKLTQQVTIAQDYRKRSELANNFKAMLETFKKQLCSKMRQDLEKALNKNIHCLLDSNNLIQKICVDEAFRLTYLDKNQQIIGMGSLSAGMKQLMATNLLWSLKEASRHPLPMVIDTPLGRLDRGHQDNLLRHYYPHAAKQMIILPTDSELTEEKKRLLAPHIAQFFELHNPGGENTEIKETTPQGVTHG